MSTASNELTHDNFTTFFALSPPELMGGMVSMALQNVAEAATLRTSESRTHDFAQAATAPGFRHFLGTPNPSQRFRAFGVDPLSSPEVLPQLRRLMHGLSRRMDEQIKWPSHTGRAAEYWENPLIPSGYTYLLQFVAHDLVHSAIPLSVAGGLGGGTANARRTPLRLETLFGSGPVGSPHIYALDAPNDDRRTKLRLGRMRWKENEPRTGCPFRDIARTRAENVTGIDRSVAGVRVALTEALVADPRNDDHAVMSQLTALFALLHNALIDVIRRQEDNIGPNGQFGAAYKRFLCAREALTAIYHSIIRNDLMRRVIHPMVYAPVPHGRTPPSGGSVTMINPCGYKGLPLFVELASAFPETPFLAVPTWGTTDSDRAALSRSPTSTSSCAGPGSWWCRRCGTRPSASAVSRRCCGRSRSWRARWPG